MIASPRSLAGLLLVLFAGSALGQDEIEFLSGAKMKGRVVQIRKAERVVVFEAKFGQQLRTSDYPYAKIHAVLYRGKRYVLSPKAAVAGKGRSMNAVRDHIARVGPTPPDWLAETALDYPDTLDLAWPMPAPKPWNSRKNMGQYIWDRINPNEGRWRSGIKLLHHLVAYHKDDSKKPRQVMSALGGMYFRLFQDYPRAAYWWQQARTSKRSVDGVSLAECYFRLGSKQLALRSLDLSQLRVESVKLLADMGETRRALQMADAYASRVKEPQWALLAAGDACRATEDYARAIRYYQRVLDGGKMRNAQYEKRATSRAQQSIDAIRQFELLDLKQLDDGDYEAESLGYEGPIAVRVRMKGGRIEELAITKHKEKQFYSALRDMPAQIIAKQSIKDVDATSRATITAEAIVSATAKALTKDKSSADKKFR